MHLQGIRANANPTERYDCKKNLFHSLLNQRPEGKPLYGELTRGESFKIQHPSSKEAPILNLLSSKGGIPGSDWNLDFGISLELGCWSLELQNACRHQGFNKMNSALPVQLAAAAVLRLSVMKLR
jgi:hypothetical protein